MFMFSMPRKGIVNVKMVITEEKILSNIEKINKLIDPKSKRQIIELEDDSSFNTQRRRTSLKKFMMHLIN